MSITKTASGKWNARFPVGGGEYGNKVFDKQRDALAYEAKMRELVRGGATYDPKNAKKTVEAVAWDWYELQPDTPNYRQNINSHLRNHLIHHLGKRQIGTITEDDLQRLVKRLSEGAEKCEGTPNCAGGEKKEPLVATSVRTIMTTVGMIFRYARKRRYLLEDPMLDLKLPKVVQRQVRPLHIRHVRMIADNIFPRYRALVLFAAATGLRQGEVFGVKIEDINWVRGQGSVTIWKQIQSYTGSAQKIHDRTKSLKDRTVPLDDPTLDLLEKHIVEFPPTDGFVFTNSVNKPLHRRVFDRAFDASQRRTVRALKVEADELFGENVIKLQVAYSEADRVNDEVFHSLRHFYASLLARRGLSPRAVADLLGHASVTTTLNKYTHFWPDDNDRAREATSVLWVD